MPKRLSYAPSPVAGLTALLSLLRVLFESAVLLVVFALLFAWERPALALERAGLPDGPTLALRGGTVWPGDGSAARPLDVLIRDGVVSALAEPGTAAPADAEIVDVAGRFLLPGFVDTHTHVALGPVRPADPSGSTPLMAMDADPQVGPRSLRTLLAFGVTSARDPGGPAARTVAMRDAVAADALPGPRLVVAGEVIDTTPFPGLTARVTSADEVRAEVRRQAETGVDLIKLYAGLSPELIRAGVGEARRHDLPAVAHLLLTTWEEGAQAGLHSILHVIPGSPRMLPEDERAAFQADLGSTLFMFTWFEFVDFESPAIRRTVEALVEQGTWVDPTLVVFEAAAFGDDPERTDALPHLELAAASLRRNWETSFRFDAGWSAADYDRAQAAWPRALEWVRRLHRAGVRLTAGTDANNPWVVPGPSFHRELELLVEAGIPESEVLRIATRNGAEALGLLERTGTLEAGKQADLVVLRENPLESIGATSSIELVVQGGRRWRPADLLPGAASDQGPDAPHSP